MKANIKIIKAVNNEYVYALITKAVTIVCAFAQSVIVARYLGAELKGNNSFISSVVSISSIVILFGMHQSYPQFKMENEGNSQYIIDSFISLAIVIYSAFFLLALTVCLVFFSESIVIIAIAILTPIYAYTRLVGYVCLIEQPNTYSRGILQINLTTLVLTIGIVAFFPSDIYIALLILSLSNILKAIRFTRLLKIKLTKSKVQKEIMSYVLRKGFYPMCALLLTTLNYRIDVIMLKASEGITGAMIGVYSVGITIAEHITIIPDTLEGILASRLTHGRKENEVAKVCRISLASCILVCLLILLVGKNAVDLLYGPEYINAFSVILIAAIGVVFVSLNRIISAYNIVAQKQVINARYLIIGVIINVVLNYLFVPIMGIDGAALATTISFLCSSFLFASYFCKVSSIGILEILVLTKDDILQVRNILSREKKSNVS